MNRIRTQLLIPNLTLLLIQQLSIRLYKYTEQQKKREKRFHFNIFWKKVHGTR